MSLQIALGDADPVAVALARSGREATVWIDGRPHRAALEDGAVVIDGERVAAYTYAERDVVHVHAFGRAWRLEVSDPVERERWLAEQGDVASAPMPGTVIAVAVQAGEDVVEGQRLMVIESMKMQSEIVAWRAGTIARMLAAEGQSFERGAALVELVPEES